MRNHLQICAKLEKKKRSKTQTGKERINLLIKARAFKTIFFRFTIKFLLARY